MWRISSPHKDSGLTMLEGLLALFKNTTSSASRGWTLLLPTTMKTLLLLLPGGSIGLIYNSTFGNVFTVEEHRRKGLSAAIGIETCRRTLARGDIPQGDIMDDNSSSINLAYKLGLTPTGRVTGGILYH